MKELRDEKCKDWGRDVPTYEICPECNGKCDELYTCPVCKKQFCEECADEDEYIFDDMDDEWIHKECKPAYELTREHTFITGRQDKIITQHHEADIIGEHFSIEMDDAKFTPAELDAFIEYLKNVSKLHK